MAQKTPHQTDQAQLVTLLEVIEEIIHLRANKGKSGHDRKEYDHGLINLP